jgi:hypothetical protein
MGKTHSNDHLHQHTSEILDAILGPDEDFLDEDHCQEFLLALGIDPTTLLSEFKEHLEQRARDHHSRTGSVPNAIGGALRVIRGRLQSSDPMRVNPNSHIDLLLSGGLMQSSSSTFATAFRREGDDELSDADQKLLNDLQIELAADDDRDGK